MSNTRKPGIDHNTLMAHNTTHTTGTSKYRKAQNYGVSILRAMKSWGTKAPVSILLIAIMWIAFVSQGGKHHQLVEAFAIRTQGDPNFFHIFTSGLTSSTLQGALLSTVLIAVFGYSTERTLTTPRFIVAVVASQATAVPLGVGVAHALLSYIPARSADLAHDGAYLSISGWMFCTAAIASAVMPVLWRRRFRFLSGVITITYCLVVGSITAIVALTAFVVGYILGDLAFNNGKHLFRVALSSMREKRILVSLLVATIAITPLILAFYAPARSPFERASEFVFKPSVVNLQITIVCQNPDSLRCLAAVEAGNHTSLAPIALNLILVSLQLVLAYGLVRGRRAAWIGACVAHIYNLLAIFADVVVLAKVHTDPSITLISGTFSALPWMLCLITLITTRRYFLIQFAPEGLKKARRVAVMSTLVFCAVWIVSASILSASFIPNNSFVDILLETPARLVPVTLSFLFPIRLFPASPAAWFVYSWSGIVFWLGILAALFILLVSATKAQQVNDHDRARAILEVGTGDHLAFMTLWNGNSYFFTDHGYVAYRVYNGIAVTLGGPVYLDDATAVASKFEEFCDQQGYTCAWYSVGEDFERPGYKKLYVAEESILCADDVAFTGKKYQNIRTARNNAAKLGIETIWAQWDELDFDMRSKIVALSEEWVHEKALPEMGFTLGGIDELKVPGTMLLIAVDRNGHLHGVTSWMPVYEQGKVSGYTLDFMRRDTHGFRSVNELLLADAAEKAKELGWVSLSGAPLASSSAPEEITVLYRLLDKFGRLMEPLYGFRSLAASKHKFHPHHRHWYLMYTDELKLPSIVVAVMRCYLPEFSAKDARNTVKYLRLHASER